MNASARILVVDDTPMNLEMLADILVFKGYEVVKASGGKEALAKLDSERPDLVLLDVMMPDLNGYEVCRAIRANPATEMVPVVMVTALDHATERVKGIEAGADDFLSKPIHQPELLARVRSLLRVKRYHDTIQSRARELRGWNEKLEERVREQVAQIERHKETLRKSLEDSIQIIAGTVEMRDPYTAGHQRRVAGLATRGASRREKFFSSHES